jgi:hypothetical protein
VLSIGNVNVEIQGDQVKIPVVIEVAVDVLIHVTNLGPEDWIKFVADSDKDAILVESSDWPPVDGVEVHENLV